MNPMDSAQSPHPNILVFGRSRDLIETRRMVLEYSGFHVTITLDLERTREMLKTRSFDLFLLCHSLSLLDCESALSEARLYRPGMKNLILRSTLSALAGSEHDARLTAFVSPEALIAKARELTTYIQPQTKKGSESHVQGHSEVV